MFNHEQRYSSPKTDSNYHILQNQSSMKKTSKINIFQKSEHLPGISYYI